MKRHLHDQVIVITGASSGIGAATAVEAARAGMHTVLAARRADRLQAVAEKVRALGRRALVVRTDVADAGQVQQLVQQTVDEFGRLDVMFANAGYGDLGAIADYGIDTQRRMFDVNYFGTIHCVQAAAEVMRRQGHGHLVITSSIVARIGLPYHGVYCATKAAQHSIAQAMSLELESENIDVTSVHPVVTRTEFFDGASERLDRSSVFDHSPSLFVQTAEHVARRVVGALKRPCREVWPARWARWAVELAVLFHWITRKLLRRHAEDDRKIIAAGKKATADAPAVEAGSTKKAGSSVTSSAGQ